MARLFRVDYDGPGRLSIMTRPDGSDVAATLKLLREEGVTTVLSTLTKSEAWHHRVVDLRDNARENLEFFWWPIPEYDAPPANYGGGVLSVLADRLRAGDHVVVGCRLALGRSPMVAVALLMELGWSLDDAERAVCKARGRHILTVPAQRAWLRERRATVSS